MKKQKSFEEFEEFEEDFEIFSKMQNFDKNENTKRCPKMYIANTHTQTPSKC